MPIFAVQPITVGVKRFLSRLAKRSVGRSQTRSPGGVMICGRRLPGAGCQIELSGVQFERPISSSEQMIVG